MAKTAEADEIILHALKLNQNKRIHIQMNAIHRIHFGQGNAAPIQTQADYLGGEIKNTGDHKPELQHRITTTWATVRRLDLLWGKSRASIKWKVRVYDAVIVAKLMYGLSSIPLSRADANQIHAFQMRGLRGILRSNTLTGPECLIRNCSKLQTANSEMSRTRVASRDFRTDLFKDKLLYWHIPLDLMNKIRSKGLRWTKQGAE